MKHLALALQASKELESHTETIHNSPPSSKYLIDLKDMTKLEELTNVLESGC